MATYRIPNENGARQLNVNDTSGEFWSTFNIDLTTEPNKIKLARPFSVYLDTDTLIGAAPAGDSVVQAMVYADVRDNAENDIFVLTNDKIFRNGSQISTTPDECLDATVFDGKLVFTTNGDLDLHTGESTFTQNWWSSIGGAPTLQSVSNGDPANGNFIIDNIRIGEETLIVTNGSQVHGYTGGTGGGGTFTTVELDDTQMATCFKGSTRSVWIGSMSLTGEEAYVFKWNGASTNYTEAFPVGAKAVLSIEVIDNTPVIVTERGDIKLFNGAGFRKIGQFPFSTKPSFTNEYMNRKQTQTLIHPKGMKVDGRNIYMFINPATSTTPIDERTPAGLWVLNIDTLSLNHLGSAGGDMDIVNNSPIMVLPNESDGRFFFAANRGYGDNTVDGVFREDLTTTSNYGNFVTAEVESGTVKDYFKEVVLKALHSSTSEIVVKYRTVNNADYPLYAEGCAWLDANTFNTTNDLSDILTRFQNDQFDEVEVFRGTGAGRTAHITNITNSGSTYSVTVDESFGVANENLDVRFDNWQKIPETFTADDIELKRLGIDESGAWIQLKIEMRGAEGLPEVRQVLLNSNSKEEL